MRTKTLILTAAVGAASLATSMAQVFSVNTVGYINVDVPPGFSMIANQLDNGNGNRLGDLLTDVPNFSVVFKFDGVGFASSTFTFGAWSDPDLTLNPGEGAFFNSAGTETATLTFVGEVPEGDLQNPIPAGFSIRSSEVPQAGNADDLALTDALNNFDVVFQFDSDSGAFASSTLTFGAWQPSNPEFSVGEAFFINAGAATSWDRSFTVSQ